MFRKSLLTAALLVCTAAPAFAQAPGGIFVEPSAADPRFRADRVDFNGSGCNSGNADVTVLGNQLVVTFSEMQAGIGGGARTSGVNCTITAAFTYGSGISINLAQVNYEGVAVAEGRNDTAMLTRRATFAGQRGASSTSRFTRTGPFLLSDALLFATIDSCRGRPGGQALAVTNINLIAAGPSAFVDLASVDAKITLLFNINNC